VRSHAKDASAPSTHRENSTFSLGVFAAMLVCAAAFLGIGASAAGAATAGLSYGYTGEIGIPDAGGLGGTWTNPVAVSNDDGNIFIVRQGNPASGQEPAVDVIDPTSDTSLSRPEFGGFLPKGVAVSADGSEFFITDSQFINGTPQKWIRTTTIPLTYEQEPLWAPSYLQSPSGMAVDPTTGDLVIGDAGRIARVASDTGALISSFDGSTSPGGTFTEPRSVAVAPNSDVYVVDFSRRVLHFAADGSWKADLPLPPLLGPNPPVGVAVDPQNGNVAVEGNATIAIYASDDTLKTLIRVPSAQATNNVGLAFAPDGSKLYIGLNDGSAHVFTRGVQPGVDAPVVSSVTETGAHLSADVATSGETTVARIEYCLASEPCDGSLASDGSSPWHRLPDHEFSSPEPGGAIEDDILELAPNSEYLLRTYAINEAEIENWSPMTPLTTAVAAPLVTTGPASGLTDTSVQLGGSVDNTFGGQTTYHFAYGTEAGNYEAQVPLVDGVAGSLRTPRTFSQAVKGLQPATEYHYAIVAKNGGGTTVGEDRTFKTLAADEAAPLRGYEQVTPVDKKGVAVLATWGFQAAPDGSAFQFAGSQPSSDAESAVVVSRYVSRRGESNWIGAQPLDPPFSQGRAIINSLTLGVSDDFTHAMVVSPFALTPDATEAAANLYIRDLGTGKYQLLGTATQNGAFNGFAGIQQLDTFTAGAPDFSWVVVISRYPLLPGAPQTAMYKWTSAGGLSLISRLPDNSIPTGTVRSQVESTRIAQPLVSEDGHAVTFTLQSGNDGAYRRSGGQTEPVSVSEVNDETLGTVQPASADGISADGRYVFFNSNSRLTEDDEDGVRSEYRYDALAPDGERLEYLAPQDGNNMADTLGIAQDGKTAYFNSEGHLVAWREGQPIDVVSPEPVRVFSYGYASPNGRYFEFVKANETAYLYSADTGETVCISCTPDGKPAPAGLPIPDRNISNRIPHSITDEGKAYFNTNTALLAADRNGTSDVYEYYRGRLTLISPGDGDFAAILADISDDGSDVFFSTTQGLVSQDTDQGYDIYDARIGGGLSGQNPPPPLAPCGGEDCRTGTGSPPADPNLGSSAISFANQVKKKSRAHPTKKCKKGKAHKKGKKCSKAKRTARSTNSNAGGAK